MCAALIYSFNKCMEEGEGEGEDQKEVKQREEDKEGDIPRDHRVQSEEDLIARAYVVTLMQLVEEILVFTISLI